ncbi:DUF3817 domain-containing protein [Rhodococcus sp. W8901]|uniref:DUF3817 domain-containing protein n=1 Tax=Rhodococcus sp. W8901 TaxID=2742603 RepID=UPI001583528F|nr:DUF3817 domain-containing protein [Rhodococcus sp. W8901]QKT14060.1 DUF3817 domain-containing protein [Rhodococcus sp. W8901]
MAAMANFFDLSSWPKRFRCVAVLEAFSWAGLLIGMAFKHIPEINGGPELGVKVFGPIHGAIFVIYVIVALFTARAVKWDFKTLALAMVSSIPPFMTIWFEMWAARNGRLGELSTTGSAKSEPALA